VDEDEKIQDPAGLPGAGAIVEEKASSRRRKNP